ncbi:uncharacterized protein LOC134186677 isoform X2 [Corticium candelabrum]|nr:uncharacterized protein LOC134186677 isoform X2 [Corticium candelabrum]
MKLEEFQLQSTLLSAHSAARQQQASVYNEFTKRIKGRQAAVKGPREKEVTYCHSESVTTPGRVKLESTCTKQVRDVCESIGKYLLELNDSKEDESDEIRKELQDKKDRIWTDLERVLSEHLLPEVLQSLLEVSHTGCQDLSEQTNKVNIRKDAENLRFKYEEGHLKDMSSPKPFMESVKELIEGLQRDHIRCFLDHQEAANEFWRGRERLLQLEGKLDGMLSMSNEAVVSPVIRLLISCRVEIAGEAAALQYRRQLVDEFLSERTAKQRSAAQLKSIRDRIQNFMALSQEKQSLIQLLVKQNCAAKQHKVSQKAELMQYIQGTLNGHSHHISSLGASLRDCVTQGVNRFLEIPVFRLRQAPNTRTPAVDMSINHLSICCPRKDVLRAVMECVGVAWYKAPEEIFTSLDKLLRHIQASTPSGSSLNLEVSRVVPKKTKEAKALVVAVQEKQEEQLRTFQPILQRKWMAASQGLATCLHVQELVQQWWTQPVQLIKTDVVFEGLTLQQWLDRWTVLLLQFRQLQSQHQH